MRDILREIVNQPASHPQQDNCVLVMSGQRPLPIPPYPGVIPYTVDRRDKEDGAGGQSGGRDSSPRLLAMEQRPVSVGSFGPPSTQTVPGLASSGELSEEQLRDKFYAYWNRQKVTAIR